MILFNYWKLEKIQITSHRFLFVGERCFCVKEIQLMFVELFSWKKSFLTKKFVSSIGITKKFTNTSFVFLRIKCYSFFHRNVSAEWFDHWCASCKDFGRRRKFMDKPTWRDEIKAWFHVEPKSSAHRIRYSFIQTQNDVSFFEQSIHLRFMDWISTCPFQFYWNLHPNLDVAVLLVFEIS